ncbi:MAG: OmpA family protein [Bryobacterales bacterium]|nr:OmpA family protein [Bryobacterales bacterium]
MYRTVAIGVLIAGATLASGCATKKFVRNTAAPIQAKVDQVSDQANRNSGEIADAQRDLKSLDERSETGISAARERAMTAEGRANQAFDKATTADGVAREARTLSERNREELVGIRAAFANLDQFELSRHTTVLFGFDRDKLTPEGRQKLDEMAANLSPEGRWVIAVEGFTDPIGPADYNLALSRRRAEAVVNYLIVTHEVPVYRIHQIGLGKSKPVSDEATREARSKSRRVEVKVYTTGSLTETGREVSALR